MRELFERGNGESLWREPEPERGADREMVRKMVGKALEIGVTSVMENITYISVIQRLQDRDNYLSDFY